MNDKAVCTLHLVSCPTPVVQRWPIIYDIRTMGKETNMTGQKDGDCVRLFFNAWANRTGMHDSRYKGIPLQRAVANVVWSSFETSGCFTVTITNLNVLFDSASKQVYISFMEYDDGRLAWSFHLVDVPWWVDRFNIMNIHKWAGINVKFGSHWFSDVCTYNEHIFMTCPNFMSLIFINL